MPATSTLKNVVDTLTQELGVGTVLLSFTGTTTTLTLTTTGSSEMRGPFTASKYPIGSPIVITAGGTPLEDTYVSGWVPSSGVITVSPAITTGATDAVLLDATQIEHGDRLVEAVKRAILNRVSRWQPTPLTFVPDGDLRGVTVTDYWTAAANGTAAYVAAQVFPAGSAADAVGDVGLNRLLQLTTAGGSSNVDGNGIRVVLSSQQRPWYFLTAIRLVSGTGTATFSIRDSTNSADITLQVMRGNDSNTLTMTTFGDFMICEGTFQLPATCAEIAPRLSLSATGMVAQMGPLIMFPQNAMSFPLPNRIESNDFIGNYHYGTTLMSPGGMHSIAFSEPITTEGRTHTYSNNGDHRTVTFNFMPLRPLWFDELVSDPELTAMTSTTTFPLDQVVKWAKFELAKNRYQQRTFRRPATSPEEVSAQAGMRRLARELQREAEGSVYEPVMINVKGRV